MFAKFVLVYHRGGCGLVDLRHAEAFALLNVENRVMAKQKGGAVVVLVVVGLLVCGKLLIEHNQARPQREIGRRGAAGAEELIFFPHSSRFSR